MDESRKQFADEVEKVIQAELKAILEGKERSQITECDERMVMCLNRISMQLQKLGFKS